MSTYTKSTASSQTYLNSLSKQSSSKSNLHQRENLQPPMFGYSDCDQLQSDQSDKFSTSKFASEAGTFDSKSGKPYSNSGRVFANAQVTKQKKGKWRWLIYSFLPQREIQQQRIRPLPEQTGGPNARVPRSWEETAMREMRQGRSGVQWEVWESAQGTQPS